MDLNSLKRGTLFAQVKEPAEIPAHAYVPEDETGGIELGLKIKAQTLEGFAIEASIIFAKVAEDIQNGNLDALPNFMEFKKFQKIVESFETVIKAVALNEAQKYPKAQLSEMGLSVCETGDRPDYSQDEVFCDLEKQLNARKKLLDLAFKGKTAVVYENSGELVEPPKVKSFSTTYLRFAEKK